MNVSVLALWAMFLSVPFLSIAAIRRRTTAGRSWLRPAISLLCWVVEVAAIVAFFLSGRWYSEGGTSSTDVTWLCLSLVALIAPWLNVFLILIENKEAHADE